MSAESEIVDRVETAFRDAGFRVARNAPFAGGYITERYGRPASGVSAVQIEIDRALYLDQLAIQPGAGYDRTAEALRGVVARLCDLVREEPGMAAPLAAE
jgi:N-formylglutamate deformylase